VFLSSPVVFIDTIGYVVVVPILPIYSSDLGVSDFQVGFLFATYAIAVVLSSIPLGVLADKWGRKPFVLFGMYAMALASGTPSALVDWNNNYADDPDKCVLFHCGNWPKSFFPQSKMGYAEILATTLGQERTYGTIAGRVPPGPVTFARISTDDLNGRIRTYVAEGMFTADELKTFGCRAVAEVPRLQELMQYFCKNGFEHHTAMNGSHVADVLAEAFETYFGWEVYRHS